jgi:hypothetical protein
MTSKAKNREKPCDLGWRSDRLDTQMIGTEATAKIATRIIGSPSPPVQALGYAAFRAFL